MVSPIVQQKTAKMEKCIPIETTKHVTSLVLIVSIKLVIIKKFKKINETARLRRKRLLLFLKELDALLHYLKLKKLIETSNNANNI